MSEGRGVRENVKYWCVKSCHKRGTLWIAMFENLFHYLVPFNYTGTTGLFDSAAAKGIINASNYN